MAHVFAKVQQIQSIPSLQSQTHSSVTMKEALRETQTLHAGCSKAEPKIFTPLQTPFPGGRDGQNLLSWRWSHYLYVQTQFGRIDARNFELSWKQTHKHTSKPTNPATDRTDYNTVHCS